MTMWRRSRRFWRRYADPGTHVRFLHDASAVHPDSGLVTGPVIHTYQAAESGLRVNSYLIEGASGVVIVDTNLLTSDIAALRARLKALKKPLRAILITHAHPDHFN